MGRLKEYYLENLYSQDDQDEGVMVMDMHREHCDRCKKETKGITIMSWFTQEVICMKCEDQETKLKSELRKLGKGDMEGCGYIPKVKK